MLNFIQKSLWKYALCLTSAFSTASLLKARVQMLYRKPSAKLALAKFGFALPALVLCVLFTAFTQRERILPAPLAKEAEQVAQRFMGEVQKAFLPTVVQEKGTIQPFKEDVTDVSFSENLENIVEIPMLTPIQKYEVIHILPPTGLNIGSNIPLVIDSIKKEKKPSKKLQRATNRLDKMLPFSLDNHLNVKSIDLNKAENTEISLVLAKNKEHLIRFCDTRAKMRNAKAIEVQAEIEITQNGVAIPVKKVNDGFVFTPSKHRAYKIIAKNLPKTENLTMSIYEQSDYFSYPDMSLLDEKGNKVKWNDSKDSKTNLRQKFKLVFSKKGKYEDLRVEEALITVRNKEKGVTFEKVVTTETFSLADLPIQKDDWVVVEVTEFSGKLNGEIVKNPKNTRFSFDDVFTFAINPKLK